MRRQRQIQLPPEQIDRRSAASIRHGFPERKILKEDAKSCIIYKLKYVLSAAVLRGIASELISFAEAKADELGVPLLFDTDMKEYADMYRHFGCELYNTVTADNGVTRYSLCYKSEA